MSLQHTLKALADPIRRKILNMLKDGRLSAGEIAGHFPVTAASISRHLSVLKDADLIRDKREGKFIYYELNASVLEEVMLWIADLKGETDHEKMIMENKGKLILSSLVVVLPALLGGRMVWEILGLLAAHWICLGIVFWDNARRSRAKKLWISFIG